MPEKQNDDSEDSNSFDSHPKDGDDGKDASPAELKGREPDTPVPPPEDADDAPDDGPSGIEVHTAEVVDVVSSPSTEKDGDAAGGGDETEKDDAGDKPPEDEETSDREPPGKNETEEPAGQKKELRVARPLRKGKDALRNKKPLKGRVSFSNGNGLTNGTRKGMVNGLTNGKGLSNGNVNGLRNRKGLSNGNGQTDGNGLTNGRGKVNGLRRGRVNGNGLVNGDGYTNGRRKGIVNGLVNGRGIVNGQGLTNGQKMAVDDQSPRQKKSSWKAAAAAIGAIIVVLMLVVVYIQTGGEKGIRVDGQFSDWDSVKKYTDDLADCTVPGINIVEYSFQLDGTQASFFAKSEGRMMEGRNAGIDSFYVFIDSDQNTETGYLIDSVGAEFVLAIDGYDGHVSSSGLYKFVREGGRVANDWNSRQSVGACRAAVSGNRLEAQAALTDIGAGAMNVLYLSRDASGVADFTNLIGTEKSSLRVLWSRTGPATVATGSTGVSFLRAELSASGSKVSLNSLKLTLQGASDNDISRVSAATADGTEITGTVSQFLGGAATIVLSPAIEVPAAGSRTVVITLSVAQGATAGRAVGLSISSPADVSASTKTVTVESGSKQMSYIGQAGARIQIDGAFDDWGGYQTRTDALGDVANPDIDVTDFRLTNDTGALYFYVQVDGAVMGGTGIPETKLRPQTGPGGGPGGPPVQLPVLVGEDALFLFVDTDNNTATGYNGGGLPIGADCLVNITGQYGKISYRKFHDFTGGASRGTWSWSNGIDVAAANDVERLEAGVPMSSLHNPTGNISVFYYTTDWKSRKDTGDKINYNLQTGGGRRTIDWDTPLTPYTLKDPETGDNLPQPVHAPEFKDVFLPVAGTVFIAVIIRRRSFRRSRAN